MKGYGFLSFARNIRKNISNNYGQKPADTAKKSAADVIKFASKRANQKTAEATGDLVANKNADKITSTSKKSLKKPHDEESSSTEINKEMPKRNIYLQKKGNKLLMN